MSDSKSTKRKFKVRIHRMPVTITQNNLLPKRYAWNFEPADGFIGYGTSGDSYTKLGAIVKIKLLLWLHRRRERWTRTEVEL